MLILCAGIFTLVTPIRNRLTGRGSGLVLDYKGRDRSHGCDPAQASVKREDDMALKELERLTIELQELAHCLREETRPQARVVIMQRVQEIMELIGKGL